MAKKVRRVKKKKAAKSAPDEAAQTQVDNVRVVETSDEIFRREYAYVVSDLRRVLLVSGAMFILLIALNLLLR